MALANEEMKELIQALATNAEQIHQLNERLRPIEQLSREWSEFMAIQRDREDRDRTKRALDAMPQTVASQSSSPYWGTLSLTMVRNTGFWIFLAVLSLVLGADRIMALLKLWVGH